MKSILYTVVAFPLIAVGCENQHDPVLDQTTEQANSQSQRSIDPDFAKLNGRWKCETTKTELILTITNNKMIVHIIGANLEADIAIDSTKSPKEVDRAYTKSLLSDPTFGIYKFEDGQLILCWGADGVRPTQFSKGNGHVLQRFARINESSEPN